MKKKWGQIDFFHASEYLADASKVFNLRDKEKQKEWLGLDSACKVLVKQRLCISGDRWSHLGANCILKLRAVNLTDGRWKEFWEEKIS